ncbi:MULTISPECIES: hypothetical protein [Bacillus]|uniref:hypothetical protein n=1 Tax=Bacillus TaxID=1386 RepID=UPI001E4E4324|nr:MULTISPECIES: hypothetical protein [Bacillus]MEC5308410.1 hypothetical protein [Bacillus thuringiensis]
MNLKRKGKEMTNIKENIPTDLQYPHSTEPAQTQTPAPTIPMQDVPVIPESEPTTIPLEPIEQVESSIPESFHIHYAGLRSKQKVIHQLQALATLLEGESHVVSIFHSN